MRLSYRIVLITIAFIFLRFYSGKAQNPSNIQLSSQLVVPVDEVKRAKDVITLQPGFKYGAGTSGSKLILQISSYPSYVQPGYAEFDESCLNPGTTSTLVGEVDGNFAVTPNGNAVYSIPIKCSPGTAGMQPLLNISYMSGGANGIMGSGWNLGGVSSITRTNKSPYFDAKYEPVKLGLDDVFAINGSRLLLKSGTSGSAGSTYGTEIETFSNVTANGQEGFGPQAFIVKDKNGIISEFGVTPDARLTSVGGTTILAWLINKVTDQYGNYMIYHYTQLDGEVLLNSIEYTGNTSMAPYNEIVFEYMPKTEKTVFYEGGQEFRKTQLLKSITATAGGELVKKYFLSYEFSFSTILSKITEVNKDGTEVAPTTFCWKDPYDNSTVQGTQNISLYSSTNANKYANIKNTMTADLNSDGFADVLTLDNNNNYEVLINPFVQNYNTNNSGGFTSAQSIPNPLNSSFLLGSYVYDSDFDNNQEVYNFFNDANNLKKYYLQQIKTIGVSNINQLPIVQISQIGSPVILTNNINVTQVPSRFYYDKNDYSADGNFDELIIDGENIKLITGSGSANFTLNPSSMIARPLDFDGDGSLEIAVFEDQTTSLSVKILKYTTSGFSVYYSGSISFAGNNSADLLRLIGIGDYNGDSKTDVAFMNGSKTTLSVCFSTGNVLTSPVVIDSFTPLNASFLYNISCPDINGDGINDIMITQDGPAGFIQNYTSYFSVGKLFIKGTSGSGKFKDNVFQVMKYYYTVGGTKYEISKTEKTKMFEYSIDFNGDGTFDYLSIDGTNTAIVTNNLVNSNPKFISNIYTGMGKNIKITYCNTATRFDRIRTSVYQDAYNPAYTGALITFKPSNFVVSNVMVQANYPSQLNYEKQYVYQGAVFHKHGKGFLGFEQFTEIDKNTTIGSVTSFILSPTNFERTSSLTTSAKFSTYVGGYTGQGAINVWTYNYSSVVSENKVNFQHTAAGNNRFFIAPSEISQRNFLNSTGSKSNFTYDLTKDGNITQQLNSYGWPGNVPDHTEQIDKTYQQVNGLFKPLQIKTKNTQGTNTSYDREVNFTFDGAGRLAQVVNDPLLANQSLVKVYSQFNAFGLPTKAQISSGDIVTRESQTIYDPTGRFIIKTINPKSDVAEFVYDPKYGSLLQSKDISGLISKYTYDGLGRIIKSVLPDNTTNTVSYQRMSNQNNPEHAFYVKTVLNEGSPPISTEYDHFGHVVRTITEDLQGNIVYTDNIYDETGLIEDSEPHFDLTNPSQLGYLVHKYTRDGFQRPLKTETFYKTNANTYNTKGLYTIYGYNASSNMYNYVPGEKQVVDQSGKTLIQKNNAAGQIITVTNQVNPPASGPIQIQGDLQTSTYTYHSNGNPLTATLSYSNINDIITHTFDYDALGNKIKLIDPTIGTVNYTYNTIGEMLHQDDANGYFDYTYDVLGRIEQKVGAASGTSTYQYVTAAAGKNQLQKITGPNVTTELSYDYLGRPLTYKETIPTSSKVFLSTVEYDAYSRLSKYTYPSGFITKYVYAPNGAGLQLMTDDANNPIWQHNGQNATGQITEYTYGNGIATTNVFTDLHYLQSVTHGNIHKQEYVFDQIKGNLQQRTFTNIVTNNVNKEAFNFDDLDRLNKSEQLDPTNNIALNGTANNITIDIKGNIIHKDDAATGNYDYLDPTKPYNITQINSPTSNLSSNALNVTINDIRKASQITESATGKEMNFIYGNDNERIKVDYLVNTINQYSRYYQSNYEREETASDAKEWTYIYAPTGLAAIFYKPTSAATGELLYALMDHLGSPVLLTNTTQQILEEYGFDAWGRRRNPANWTYTGFNTPTILHRGFTMHEHMDEFKLINMNGRIYDAVLGRFIQPDNQVQDPGFLQTFNKFAYVFNNPLSFTDPSGWAGGSGNGSGNDDGDTAPIKNSVYSSMYYGFGTSIIWGSNYYNIGTNNPSGLGGSNAGGNTMSTSGMGAMTGMSNSSSTGGNGGITSGGGRGTGGSANSTFITNFSSQDNKFEKENKSDIYNSAQSIKVVPFGEKGSILGLPDIAPNMFPGVGIEVNIMATITGRGYYDNKTKTLQLPIGAKTSYAQHEYGHYLQSLRFTTAEYNAIESASFWNAVFNSSKEHEYFWTERDANRRSIEFFGPNSEIAKFGLWPR